MIIKYFDQLCDYILLEKRKMLKCFTLLQIWEKREFWDFLKLLSNHPKNL